MLGNMKTNKKLSKKTKINPELNKEFTFMKSIFSMLPMNLHNKVEGEDDSDVELETATMSNNIETKRARSITELKEKLQKAKSQNTFNLKSKLAKKSLTSKLNKKLKKRERHKAKGNVTEFENVDVKKQAIGNAQVNVAKPIFNNDGKVVFSKFDFATVGQKEKKNKANDPRKILENLKQQEDKFLQLEQTEDSSKVKELKEKLAWKNILHKAEGQKIKDDPTLLKKSIKKMEHKKSHSKKQWEGRLQSVEQKKSERQKKRKENIAKKKKEKKSKVIKAAVKRGRVVI